MTLVLSFSCQQKGVRIMCIGDSITEGAGLANKATESYPACMQKLLGRDFTIFNFGVSARTAQSTGDYPWILEPECLNANNANADYAVLMLGTNDSKVQNWVSDAHFKEELQNLIQDIQKMKGNPEIFLCKPLPAFEEHWTINDSIISNHICPIVEELAASENCHVIDLYKAFEGKGDLCYDGIHPNAKGAQYMAEVISKSLSETLTW